MKAEEGEQMQAFLGRYLWLMFATLALASGGAAEAPDDKALDAELAAVMERTGARGLALAVIRNGEVTHVRTRGVRNVKGEPLQADTIMYGASLTKTAFASLVLQLADEKRLDLDASIATYLRDPLPAYPTEDQYAAWSDLSGDERWRALTPRILLSHRSGFANFGFLEPDGKLRIHFAPGTRYAYSGEGYTLLQFVLARGMGLDVGTLMQSRVFDRFGMRNTSMVWRPAFAANLADGWDADGRAVPHDERSRVRAAGSMDTTIADIARFVAGLVRGTGLTPASRAEMTRPQLPITTASQFPTLQPELPAESRAGPSQSPRPAAGLGVIVFDGPQGRGFFKGGHNESTGNTLVCVERTRDCVVILANDVRAEPAFPRLVEFVLGDVGVPWRWEYGDMRFIARR